jgi:hypothetical protein
VVEEDGWCPILGLFSPAVLGSGEGDREWVLAIRERLLGTAIREGTLLLRLWSSADGRTAWRTIGWTGWPRPQSIFAPYGDTNAIDYASQVETLTSLTNRMLNNNVANATY